MKKTPCIIVVVLLGGSLAPRNLDAKAIKPLSFSENIHTYTVEASPNIIYPWKTTPGEIVKGQGTNTIAVKCDGLPAEITVDEAPVFNAYIAKPE